MTTSLPPVLMGFYHLDTLHTPSHTSTSTIGSWAHAPISSPLGFGLPVCAPVLTLASPTLFDKWQLVRELKTC